MIVPSSRQWSLQTFLPRFYYFHALCTYILYLAIKLQDVKKKANPSFNC